MTKTRQQTEFGDYQTPLLLAREVAAFIENQEDNFRSVVEPTCGVGSFLQAAIEIFGKSPKYFGFDINPEYIASTRSNLQKLSNIISQIKCEDFYQKEWKSFFANQSPPILVIGNLPWVTNAAMGILGGNNLPIKTNFQSLGGFAAKTGKANFDISEWMLIRLLESLQGIQSTIAILCKTATARKVLRHVWLNDMDVGPSSVHRIDATLHFGVSVDACLLYSHTGTSQAEITATIYPSISFANPQQTFGLIGREIVSDIHAYRNLCEIVGLEYRKWRSGVKHDAVKVMVFRREYDSFVNGFGESYPIEMDCLYPLLKSSDLANNRLKPSRYVLLTQNRIADDTSKLKYLSPQTWQYLICHAKQLDGRRSSIYTKRARFSIFGIGDYTFAPWKVAISGLYKNLRFQVIGSYEGKPIILDDTCYFIPCESESEAQFFADLLNSDLAHKFISTLIFTDAKRPITIDILKRIDLKKLAEYLGEEQKAIEYLSSPTLESNNQRLLVFEEKENYRNRAFKVKT